MVSKNWRLFGPVSGHPQNKKISSASRQNKKKEGKEWAGPPNDDDSDDPAFALEIMVVGCDEKDDPDDDRC